MLSVILQSEINIINLGSNNIDSFGAVTIAEYLEGDPPIEEFGLDYNRLNDDDAMLISQALKRNTNMEVLSIHSNNFTSTGVKALLTCVFDGSSLNAISESNHKLGGMVMFLKGNNETNDRLQDYINRLLELYRTQKIVLALQDKDSLAQYLANVPVELMPEVLAFIRQKIYHSPHKHLSIVYSTMRLWNMPLLYSYYTLKAAVYAEVARSLEDSVSIDDICINIKDRTMVDQVIRSLEDDNKVMRS
jgi:serine/threonine protein kinase